MFNFIFMFIILFIFIGNLNIKYHSSDITN